MLHLNYARNNIGVFTTSEPDVSFYLKRVLPEEVDVDIYIYESQHGSLVLMIGGTHLQPITDLLNIMHCHYTKGGSFLGVAFSKLLDPPKCNIDVELLDIRDCSKSLITALSLDDQVMAIHNISDNTAWLIHEEGIKGKYENVHDVYYSSIYKHWSYYFMSCKNATKRHFSSNDQYDPITAQLRELACSKIPFLISKIDDLSLNWTKVFDIKMPNDIMILKDLNNDYIRLINKLIKSPYKDSSIFEKVQKIARNVEANLELCERYMYGLEFYKDSEDCYCETVRYDKRVSYTFLKAFKQFADELITRLHLENDYVAYPFFSIYNDIYIQKTFMLFTVDPLPKQSQQVIPLFIPNSVNLRLGCLPLIAHLLSHLIISNELLLHFIELIKVNDLDLICDMQLGERKNLQTIEEVFADLIASAICGPAYVFALSRFALGTISDFDTPTPWVGDHPPLPIRLGYCLGFLHSMGFDILFQSNYDKSIVIKRLSSNTIAFLKDLLHPYKRIDHNRATKSVKKILMQGTPVNEEATIILNALWDGVSRKSGYVDEYAALYSISVKIKPWAWVDTRYIRN